MFKLVVKLPGMKLIEENKLWAGIVFQDIPKDSEDMPEFIHYKIRVDSDRIDTTRYERLQSRKHLGRVSRI